MSTFKGTRLIKLSVFVAVGFMLTGGCSLYRKLPEIVTDPAKEQREQHQALQQMVSDRSEQARWKAVYSYMHSGDNKRAFEILNDLQNRGAPQRRVDEVRAELFIAQDQFDQASQIYAGLLHQYPNDPELHHLYAVSLELSGNAPAAQVAFQQAEAVSQVR